MSNYKNWWYRFVREMVTRTVQDPEASAWNERVLEAMRYAMEQTPADERVYIIAILIGKSAGDLASDSVSKTNIERIYNRFINRVGYRLGI